MNVVMTKRELREQTHENRRRDLLLRCYRLATVGEVDESNFCNGLCRGRYEGKRVRVVEARGGCEYHGGRS